MAVIVNLIGASAPPAELTTRLEAHGITVTGTASWELVGGHPYGMGHEDITKALEDGYRPCSVTTINLSTTSERTPA